MTWKVDTMTNEPVNLDKGARKQYATSPGCYWLYSTKYEKEMNLEKEQLQAGWKRRRENPQIPELSGLKDTTVSNV